MFHQGSKVSPVEVVNDDDTLISNLNMKISPLQSKLPPLAGAPASGESQLSMLSLLLLLFNCNFLIPYIATDSVQRYLSELLAPTPTGQEPKLVELAKTVTWGCVILLVLVEIVVSVKVGGLPFQSSSPPPPSLSDIAPPASF